MGKPTDRLLVEDCLALDLAWLMRLGSVRTGQTGRGEINWSYLGAPTASVSFRLELRKTSVGYLTLRRLIEGFRQSCETQTILLTATRQHFGGQRWWMLCPETGERVRLVYLAPDAKEFVGRNALGLSYAVERLGRFDRPFEKLFRAQAKLGIDPRLGAKLVRPKGMWGQTFARHTERIGSLDVLCADQIASLVGITKEGPVELPT